MATILSPQNLRAFFDANPARYKTATAAWPVLSDGYLPSWALEYQLCTPSGSVANPVVTPAKVPAPFTAEQILTAITTADALKVVGSSMVSKLLESINAQDRPACLAWASLCLAAGYITASEQTAIQAIVNGTVNDPTWTAQIPGPCDLAANFRDGLGQSPTKLEFARNADGSPVAANGVLFIHAALGRS